MRRADQLLADVQFGDAVTDHALALQGCLRNMGYQSDIYAENIHPLLADKAKSISEFYPGQLVIHHFAIGSGLNEAIKQFSGCKKVLIYHNITPPAFFEGYNLHSQVLCSQAQEQLGSLCRTYDMSIGVSDYNCAELRELGFSNLHTLPILYDFDRIDAQVDQTFLAGMDGTVNLLFLGRIAPNKRQEDVIKAFYLFQRICPNSRLYLAGGYQGMEKYLNELVSLTYLLGLQNKVSFLGKVSYAVMAALYKGSHLFLSMSEHEGFCVPLIEAMHFDLPVLAYGSSAVPETLGSGGVLFYEKNYPLIAEMAVKLTKDQQLRTQVIAAQQKRMKQLDGRSIKQKFESLIKELGV
ncbi:MAG: glycosyltransferase family 4 protein [Clostridia bacterium]|nr:glycosyltransferase family 4 protein [Clostridia bacterium]